MIEENNYYTIILKIEDVKNKIWHIEPKNWHMAFLSVKELIYEYKILRERYENKVRNFNELFKTQEYKQKANEAYEQVKNHLTNAFKEENLEILYTKDYFYTKQDCTEYQDAYRARIRYKKGDYYATKNKEYLDIPNFYIYSSIGAYFEREYIELAPAESIISYYTVFEGYPIKDVIDLRKDLEYFISSLNWIQYSSSINYSVISIVAAAMLELLCDLQDFISNEIHSSNNQKRTNIADMNKNDTNSNKRKKFAPQQQKIYKFINDKYYNFGVDKISSYQLYKYLNIDKKNLSSAINKFHNQCKELYNIENDDFKILKSSRNQECYIIYKEWLKLITENNQKTS